MIALLALGLAHGACDLDAPDDTAFEVAAPEDLSSVKLVVLVRVDDARLENAGTVLDALEARGLHAGISVRAGEPSAAIGAFLEERIERGHEPVVRLLAGELPVNATKGPRVLKKLLAPLERYTGRIRAAEVPLGNQSAEAILQRIGLRAAFETNGPARSAPRAQSRLEGQPNLGTVLPAGPYSGPCGPSPVARGFTPPGADRVTQALYGARGAEVGIVRLTLLPEAPSDAVVLGRWFDEVLLPNGFRPTLPNETRQAVLRGFRRSGTTKDLGQPADGGRLVRLDEVREAAEAVRDQEQIPRRLPGDLSPTEAFQAFLLLLADRKEMNVVRLGSLDGPVPAKATLTEPRAFTRVQTVALATALLDDLPKAIPAALPVGGKLLTAPELFTLLASAVREDDPPTARPIASPEPNATGMGWGRASTP